MKDMFFCLLVIIVFIYIWVCCASFGLMGILFGWIPAYVAVNAISVFWA